MAKIIQLKNSNNEKIYPYACLKEFILYNDSTGTNGNITLSDNVSNYKYIEIFYRDNSNHYSNVKVYQANGKRISLLTVYPNSTYHFWFNGALKNINENKITSQDASAMDVNSLYANNNIYITRIVGYK